MRQRNHLSFFRGQLLPEQRTSTVQSGHHGADWNRQVFRNVLVRQLLHVAEYDDLLVLDRNSPQRTEQVFVGELFGHRRRECHRRGEHIVSIGHDRRSSFGAPLVAADVIEDRHQPGAAIRTRCVPMKRFQRLLERVLHQILGRVTIALEPHRQPKEASYVWKRRALEAGPRRLTSRAVVAHLCRECPSGPYPELAELFPQPDARLEGVPEYFRHRRTYTSRTQIQLSGGTLCPGSQFYSVPRHC